VETRFFAKPADFRRWLRANHGKAAELWVGFHKKATGRPSITWPEAVDEALCFGWIDGIRKSIDAASYRIRFTPRRPRSIWSSVNVRRAQELIAEGRMQPAGLAEFENRREDRERQYSFEQGNVAFPEEYERRFRENAQAWTWFRQQAPYYQRVATWYVISAKREETRIRRLEKVIGDCEKGERIGVMKKD
jgi:uncharacterized protein YdeI (YjbR/CyaY-like superfamily)